MSCVTASDTAVEGQLLYGNRLDMGLGHLGPCLLSGWAMWSNTLIPGLGCPFHCLARDSGQGFVFALDPVYATASQCPFLVLLILQNELLSHLGMPRWSAAFCVCPLTRAQMRQRLSGDSWLVAQSLCKAMFEMSAVTPPSPSEVAQQGSRDKIT